MKSKTRHEVGSFLGPHRHELIERFELTSGTGYPRYMGLFICSFCGEWFENSIRNIARGHTQSCGCITSKLQSEAKLIHGLSNTKFSKHRHHIISRCYNPKNPRYSHYGGRGVTVCSSWLGNPQAHFEDISKQLQVQGLTLEDWGQSSTQYSLDRKDNDGDYEPSNIRFATPTEQINNRQI